MPYIADLHTHSQYSRATSKSSTLPGLAAWAAVKGIDLVATGDFTHPGWFAHLCEHLEPAEPGLFRLKQPPSAAELTALLPPGLQADCSRIRFLLSAEISSIYKRGGKVRKIHSILYAPDFEAVRRINSVLAGIGNLEADGRPILGLDAEKLLAVLLEQAPEGFLVPAHIWTPWFSLFGSKSGFDSIEECFGDLSSEIFALETGLSSDPEMNRHISALDRFSLISNSDCHSPSKLGRNCNIFDTELDFFALQQALRQPQDAAGRQRFQATIEFYPEEGKYHCDGHRKCGVCFEPAQTVAAKGICPECGRPLTVGVLYRVMELADRETALWPTGSPAVHSLIPLPELLGELFNCGPATKKVETAYAKLINTFGSEFRLLLATPLPEIAVVSPLLAEAIKRVREKQVIRKPGFDGEFGVIRVFAENEQAELGGQMNLFGLRPAKPRAKKAAQKTVFRKRDTATALQSEGKKLLNPEQQAAVASQAAKILVQAGPGTGKTHTLVQRAVRLLDNGQGPLAVITFTNKAAEEIRQRLAAATDNAPVWVDTFHGFCLHWLRQHQPELALVGPAMRQRIFLRQYPQLSERERNKLQRQAGLFLAEQPVLPENYAEDDPLRPYFAYLRAHNLLDLDEAVPACTALLHGDSEFAAELRAAVAHLLVDEFQDLNAAQYELVRLLAETASIFAIGDPDQAIYGFRGANPAWFRRFAEEEQPERHHLTANYRSGAAILEAAVAVIANNYPPDTKQSFGKAASNKQALLYRHAAATAAAEARFVAEQIQQLIGGTSHREIDRLAGAEGGLALSEIAILCRTARQMPLIAQALAERTIPCQAVDLQPFYLSGETKILYYWILLAAERIDQAELLVLLENDEVSKELLAAAEQVLAEQENSRSPLADLLAVDSLPELLRNCLAKTAEFAAQLAQEAPVAAVDRITANCGLNKDDSDSIRFRNMAASAVSLPAFAEHLRRHENSVIYDERAEAVLLATLHAAKGLEFKAVFVTGCEEGLLPLTPRAALDSAAEQEHLAEERRLFFVGLTRAAETLYLCSAGERQGFAGIQRQTPSHFLAEIPAELLNSPLLSKKKSKKRSAGKQLLLF
ncbi:DNA 3'-5' helicase [Candidatus Electronema halotolerans]